MIFGNIEDIGEYFEELPALQKVDAFIKDLKENDKPDGTYEIDGKHLFANIQTFRTKNQTPEMMFEAHRKYMDFMYIVSGIERIRWAKLSKVQEVKEEFSKGNDIAFYEGDVGMDFILKKGSFILFNPEDAHLPGLSAEKEVTVRKIVFKIEVQ